ncbi:predicted protein [Aspergillus terreus NIH2624]|uniref:Uncharacterized protein n=1 Tax=Aspergillus terreus (strain NIH 2624 / FGSC A1156) TaxID=341663 RepID=Q0CBH3_ASPTN|nr:uncharacterized protein ATEG_08961 [Aspergillus terreus NIH2624]EAU31093.1 predicted protein [Aspergillus terreus NIH2624]
MLEQQQAWLVYGLQELYRRTSDGEGWPGEPLKCEANGHPLTHDLLTRLGALDQAKGERFEENPDAMQQELWRQNAGHMQRQDSFDASFDSAHSPVVPSVAAAAAARFADPFAQPQLPPTPPNISPSARPVKSESSQMPPAFALAPLGSAVVADVQFGLVPIHCMSYMDLKGDYDDLNQFVNANAPEIAST